MARRSKRTISEGEPVRTSNLGKKNITDDVSNSSIREKEVGNGESSTGNGESVTGKSGKGNAGIKSTADGKLGLNINESLSLDVLKNDIEEVKNMVLEIAKTVKTMAINHDILVESLESNQMEKNDNLSKGSAHRPVEQKINTESCASREVLSQSAVEPVHSRKVGGNDEEPVIYRADTAFKIYQSALKEVRCKRVGDSSFFTAKRAWNRLVNDFPITETTQRRLLSLAFEGDARNVYEEVANNSIGYTTQQLWKKLEERLCNKVHQAALHNRFDRMRWNPNRESFESFANNLRSTALAIPNGVDEVTLLNRLKNGLPSKLRDQAQLINASFDEIVTRLSQVSNAQENREYVREVAEQPKTPTLLRKDEMITRYASYICHKCGRRGHISRYCNEKRNISRTKNYQGDYRNSSKVGPGN